MDYPFFMYQSPGNTGFQLFGARHLLVLLLLGCLIASICIFYSRSKKEGRQHWRICLSLVMLFLEVIKDIVILIQGRLTVEYLPFHLCGLTIIFSCIHTFWPNHTTAELLYCLSIPGALSALLFPDWASMPIINFFSLHSFVIHALEITYPMMLLVTKEIRPAFRNLWRPIVFLVFAVPSLYYFNKAFNTNFFFLNTPAPNSPMSFLAGILGNPGFIFGLIGLLAVVWLVMYLPFILINWLRRKNTSS